MNKPDKEPNRKSKVRGTLNDKYKINDLLSRSNYNKVAHITNIHTREQFAAKIISRSYSNISISLLEKEARIYKKVNHSNILRLIESAVDTPGKKTKEDGMKFKDKPCYFIILEFASRGEIFDYVSLNKFLFHKVAKFYFIALIHGIGHLHDLNLCHRDLKLDNLLLDEEFNLKISDFEFAAEIKNNQSEYINHKDKLGTLSYMAPEFFRPRQLPNSKDIRIYHTGDAVDVYACGVILFLLVTGNFPFQTADMTDDNYRTFCLSKSQFWRQKGRSTSCQTEDFKDLINQMLEPDPEKRIKISQIKEHGYYKGGVPTHEEVKHYMCNIWLMIERNKKGDN